MQTYQDRPELAGGDHRGAPRFGASPLAAAAAASFLRDAQRVGDFLESRIPDQVGPAERGGFFLLSLSLSLAPCCRALKPHE